MYYPAPLAGYDVKPGGKTALLVNDSSPYRGGMTFSWVGGDTQFFDNIGSAVIQYDTVRPSRTANREGMVTSFAEGALDALIVDGPPLFDYSEPWTIAFRVWLKSGLRNYVGQIQGGGVSAMQILSDDDLGNYDPLHFASNSTADMPRLQAPAGAFPKDQWNTAVVTFNGGSQTIRSNYALYVNGTSYAFDLGSAVGTTVNETRLGRTDGAGRDMDGHLSGLRVWGGRDLPPSLAIELSKRFWSPFGVPIEYSSRIFYFVQEDTGGTTIVADSGSYGVTGYDATLIPPAGDTTIIADSGTYTYTGYDATLTYTPAATIVAESGSYAYTGNDVDLLISRYMVADSGSYAYTGYDAALTTAKGLVADTGVYGYTGYDVNLIAPKKVIAETGSYGYTGYNVTLSTTAEARWQDLPGDPAGPWMDL